MAKASSWSGIADKLAGGALEATARAVIATQGTETVRQVVFGRYGDVPLAARNYLVGLVNSFLKAGNLQESALFGTPIAAADVPINPGLGGVGGAPDRYLYSTVLQIQPPGGGSVLSINVDVQSPIALDLASAGAAAAAKAQGWAGGSPKFKQLVGQNPTIESFDVIGIQRAY